MEVRGKKQLITGLMKFLWMNNLPKHKIHFFTLSYYTWVLGSRPAVWEVVKWNNILGHISCLVFSIGHWNWFIPIKSDYHNCGSRIIYFWLLADCWLCTCETCCCKEVHKFQLSCHSKSLSQKWSPIKILVFTESWRNIAPLKDLGFRRIIGGRRWLVFGNYTLWKEYIWTFHAYLAHISLSSPYLSSFQEPATTFPHVDD